jgi:hypothetical protein
MNQEGQGPVRADFPDFSEDVAGQMIEILDEIEAGGEFLEDEERRILPPFRGGEDPPSRGNRFSPVIGRFPRAGPRV